MEVNKMPGMDGTGPDGRGPMTGRGMGPCGRGYGRGFGCGFRRGRGIGGGNGIRTPISFTPEEEKKILEAELSEIEKEKKEIEQRLKEL